MLVMVTIVNGEPVSENIDIFDRLAGCHTYMIEQEFKYDFDTFQRDWVCVRLEGNWPYKLRY